jgi:hypothetical protein
VLSRPHIYGEQMSSPGNNPPTDGRSGRMGALRDSYRKVKPIKDETGEKRPWYKFKRPAK